jgi:hypothetical protein
LWTLCEPRVLAKYRGNTRDEDIKSPETEEERGMYLDKTEEGFVTRGAQPDGETCWRH